MKQDTDRRRILRGSRGLRIAVQGFLNLVDLGQRDVANPEALGGRIALEVEVGSGLDVFVPD